MYEITSALFLKERHERMPRQTVFECTRIVRFIDCIGENMYYFEVPETGNNTQTEQTAVDRFRRTIGFDPNERCMHCGDRSYSSYLLNGDEIVPDRSLDYFFPLA